MSGQLDRIYVYMRLFSADAFWLVLDTKLQGGRVLRLSASAGVALPVGVAAKMRALAGHGLACLLCVAGLLMGAGIHGLSSRLAQGKAGARVFMSVFVLRVKRAAGMAAASGFALIAALIAALSTAVAVAPALVFAVIVTFRSIAAAKSVVVAQRAQATKKAQLSWALIGILVAGAGFEPTTFGL